MSSKRSKPEPQPATGRIYVAYMSPPGWATATSVRPEHVPPGLWTKYPWPAGNEKAAGVFIPPEEEWRPILKRWLPGYVWPEEPRPDDLERVLMGEPFNLKAAAFNATLTIGRVVAKLKRPAEPLHPEEQAAWDALAGKRLKSHELATAGTLNTGPEYARQLVAKLRRKGRRVETAPGGGYWRPDAPPPL